MTLSVKWQHKYCSIKTSNTLLCNLHTGVSASMCTLAIIIQSVDINWALQLKAIRHGLPMNHG